MITETKEKKKRTPRNVDTILAGALELLLAERVKLYREIVKSIDEELALKEAELAKAKEIVYGKQNGLPPKINTSVSEI